MRRRILAAALVLLALAPAARAQTVTVEAGGQSRSLDVAALAALPSSTATREGRGGTRATFTGPLLWTVLRAGGGAPEYREAARLALLVTASDGFTAVFSLGEIAPELGARPVILALSSDDPSAGSFPRLVLPGEDRGARQVRDVVRLTIRAP